MEAGFLNCSSTSLDLSQIESCEARETLRFFQKIYWGCACVTTGLSVIALAILGWEIYRNPALRKRPLLYFYVMILGDVVFTMTYFPYHLHNTVRAQTDPFFTISTDSFECHISWTFVCVSIVLEFAGFVVISYYPYKATSGMFSRADAISDKGLIIVAAVTTFFGILWFVVGEALGQVGSYRGLYCGPISWANFNGAYLFFSASLAGSFMVFYFFKAWKALKLTSSTNANTTGAVNKEIHKAAAKIHRFGLMMVAAFLATWAPLTISCACSVFGVELPLPLDIYAGISVKVKPILDVIIIFMMPQVRNSRKKAKIGNGNGNAIATKMVSALSVGK